MEQARRDVCVHARRWRLAIGQDLLTLAIARDALLNALNRLDATEIRARAGLKRGRFKKTWRTPIRVVS